MTYRNLLLLAILWFAGVHALVAQCDASSPEVDAGEPQLISCRSPSVQLTASSPVDGDFSWSGPNGFFVTGSRSVTVEEAGLYYLDAFFPGGCLRFDSVFVTVDTIAPVADGGVDQVLNCRTTNVTLNGSLAGGQVPAWETTDGRILAEARTLAVNTPGTYLYSVTDTLNGCISRLDTVRVRDQTQPPVARILASPDTVLNCQTPRILLQAGAQDNVFYRWEVDGMSQVDQTISVESDGLYTLTVVNILTGCSASDTLRVNDQRTEPVIRLAEELRLECGREQTTLAAGVDIANALVSWSSPDGSILGGGTTLTPTIAGPGRYLVTVSDESSGCESQDSIEVTQSINTLERVAFTVRDESCPESADGTFSVDDLVGGTPPYRYALNGESRTVGQFSALAAGGYSLRITDADGCTLDSAFVVATGQALTLTLPPELELEAGEWATLRGISNVPEDQLASIQWTPAGAVDCPFCLDTRVRADSSRNLMLRISAEGGCTASAMTRLVVTPGETAYVPTAFSPNGDGRNDRFTLFGSAEVDVIERAVVANRWGETMFERNDFAASDPNLGWDGYFRGRAVPPGVYVYFFTVRLRNGRREVLRGEVVLVR